MPVGSSIVQHSATCKGHHKRPNLTEQVSARLRSGLMFTSDRVLVIKTNALTAGRPQLDETNIPEHGRVKHALQS